jgi:hypothetical protein
MGGRALSGRRLRECAVHLPGTSLGTEVADVLYEDDVVDAVCRYLEHNGYVIRQSLTSMQRGHDIIADKRGDPTWTLYVEAKGEGSSKATTARYGSSFNSGTGVRSRRQSGPQGASGGILGHDRTPEQGRHCTPRERGACPAGRDGRQSSAERGGCRVLGRSGQVCARRIALANMRIRCRT